VRVLLIKLMSFWELTQSGLALKTLKPYLAPCLHWPDGLP
jgi:hypothetical protein